MTRWVVTATLAAAAVTAATGVASAATPYPPNVPTCSVTPNPVFTNSPVTFSCSGFTPGATVTITSSGSGRVVTGTAQAHNGNGTFTAKADASGGFSVAEAVTVVGTATFIATGDVPNSGTGSGSASTQVITRTSSTPAPGTRTQVGAVTTSRPTAGQPFTFSGCGYKPGSTVTVTDTAGDSFGTSTVGADGCFHKTLIINNPGDYTLVGTGPALGGGTLTTTAHVSVLGLTAVRGAGGAGGNGGLAFTGADGIGIMVLVGGGLVGAGSALVARTRRRRTYLTV